MVYSQRSTFWRYGLAALVLGVIAGGSAAQAQAVVRRTTHTSVHATAVARPVPARGVTVVHQDRWGHPVATATAVTATAVAVGTIVRSLPPSCSVTVVGAVTYQNCGGTFYQPVYQGSSVQYVVVNPPG